MSNKVKYTFDYHMGEADAVFIVDKTKYTAEHANSTLEFFDWDYDDEADPVDEVMKKYALEAIKESTFNHYNTAGVIHAFSNKEGFNKIDGSAGILLLSVGGYEFDSEYLDMEKKEVQND